MVLDLKRFHILMQEKDLDCIVATSRENVFYSSGVWAGIPLRLAPVILPLDGDPVILVHPSGSGAGEDISVRKTSWISDVRTYLGGEWAPLDVWDAVADVLKEKGLQGSTIGLEVLDVVGKSFDYIRELLPSASFIGCEPVFNELRSIKSEEELKILTDANMATAKAVYEAFETSNPGITERQVARKIMERIFSLGANRIAFLSLAAGPNVVEPHHSPDDYKIRVGDMLHVDVGGVWNGYISDISRMAVVGEPNKEQQKAYEVIIKQMWDTAEAMQSGATVREVHNVAKSSYESHGYVYPRFFIGHSSGLRGHEHPFLGPFHGDWVLKPGMFFQLEPSHLASNVIRVHYEDSFIIREKGSSENVSEYRNSWELQTIK